MTVAPLRQRGCPVSGSVANGTVPVHGLFLPGFRGGIFGLFALQALRRWSRLVIFRTLSERLAAEVGKPEVRLNAHEGLVARSWLVGSNLRAWHRLTGYPETIPLLD